MKENRSRRLIEAGYKAFQDGQPCESPTTREMDRLAWEQGWRSAKNDASRHTAANRESEMIADPVAPNVETWLALQYCKKGASVWVDYADVKFSSQAQIDAYLSQRPLNFNEFKYRVVLIHHIETSIQQILPLTKKQPS